MIRSGAGFTRAAPFIFGVNPKINMMSQNEFENWAHRNRLSPTHAAAIGAIRTNGPVRKIGLGRSVRGLFPSAKMERHVMFESRTGEFPACLVFEADASVLEYYDQPTTFRISYSKANGTPGAHEHTPDFLVLRTNGATLVEVKHRHKLVSSLVKTPGRFVQVNDVWRSPVAEEAAAKMFGAKYSVFVPDDLSPVLLTNIQFLKNHALNQL